VKKKKYINLHIDSDIHTTDLVARFGVGLKYDTIQHNIICNDNPSWVSTMYNINLHNNYVSSYVEI